MKKQTLFTFLGFVFILIFLETIIPGSKTNSYFHYGLSIFLTPMLYLLLGARLEKSKLKELSVKRVLVFIFVLSIAFYMMNTIYYGVYNIELYGFKNGLTEALKASVSNLVEPSLKLHLLVAFIFYFLIAFVYSKFSKSLYVSEKFLVFAGVLSVISLLVVGLPYTYMSKIGLYYINFVEKNIMIYNFIFYAIGFYCLNQAKKSGKKKDVVFKSFLMILLFLSAILLIPVYRSEWYQTLGENKEFITIYIIKILEYVITYTFNILLALGLIGLIKKDKIKIVFIEKLGQYAHLFLLLQGLLICVAFIIFKSNQWFYVASVLLFIIYIILLNFVKESDLKKKILFDWLG